MQVAVVTGGGTGIGRAITTALAVNGAKVFIIGRRPEILENAAKEINESASKKGGEVITITGDILTKNGIEEVFKKLSELTDKVDYLVNNAGAGVQYKVQADINNPEELERKLWSIEDHDFTDMAAYHVSSPWFVAVKLIPLFAKSSDPLVTNIASLAAHITSRSLVHPAYGGAKAAEKHSTKLLAANLIPYKIRVNSISPGLFKSQLTSGSSDPSAPVAPIISDLMKTTPAGRIGSWEEIAGIALMLASPAGNHLNGIDILVDGGTNLVASAANL